MRRTHKIVLPGNELGDHIAEAVDFLRQHEPPEGYFVGFSGGKDSICTLHLCKLAGVKHQAVYSCTRIDPPEMYAFIKQNYPDVQWMFPKTSVYSQIVKWMPPLRHTRWCCDFLKKNPSKDHPLKHRVMGIRAEESVSRASFPRIDFHKKYKQTLYKPIFHWPEWVIWEAIEAWKLPYPSLYDEGFHRIGCVVCPFILGTSQCERNQKRWPGIWKAYEKAVKRWWKERGKGREGSAEEFWNTYVQGKI